MSSATGVMTTKNKMPVITGDIILFNKAPSRVQSLLSGCNTLGRATALITNSALMGAAHILKGPPCNLGNTAIAANTHAKTNPNDRSEPPLCSV